MASRIENIIKRFLLENEFNVDGNEFRFLSVEPYDLHSNMAFRFKVNVTLPREDMCYAVPKFEKNVEDILINLGGYIGTQFSYSIDEILVNGKKPTNQVYITSQKQKEILSELNKIGRVKANGENIKVDFNAAFRPSKDHFYYLSDVNIEFNFDIYASSFQENGTPIYPNIDNIDDLGTALAEYLNDNDNFRNIVDETIYRVLEPDMQIAKVDDLYYNSGFSVRKVDGIETSGRDWGVYLSRELFT